MDQAAEPVSPQNAHTGHFSGRMRAARRRVLMKRPVRPVDVVAIDIFAKDQAQVPFAGDQHPVQALAAGAADPAFGYGVAPHCQLHPIRVIGTDASG